ncbi:MAG: S-methyl-5-thioribose-1-phosphate isomerase [Coprothermobacterota bacterium]|nr:S-methyl-5-thioribose-1-phosphate isomerase [Coprothermobacterota bacterium]
MRALPVQPFRFQGDVLYLLDQRRLPQEQVEIACTTARQVHDAIREMAVRGAPLIGTVAAYGLYLEARRLEAQRPLIVEDLLQAAQYLKGARPTAVNLAWSIDRAMQAMAGLLPGSWSDALLAEAQRQEEFNIEWTLQISRLGSALIADDNRLMTICNTGPLATGGYGTALGAILYAHAAGKQIEVYACETRPYLQGARLTTWELHNQGVPVTLISDNMAAWTMKSKGISAVFTGADRIAINGDTANKVGTYALAILAHYHGIPLYVVAPVSSFDPSTLHGDLIPIEERNPEEVLTCAGHLIAPEGTCAFNPSFDVTPHDLISGFVTERGVIHPPFPETIPTLLNAQAVRP